MRDRFHILVGTRCNNNCVFCMEVRGDPILRDGRQTAPENVRRELEARAESGDVMFAHGEPTLQPRLLEYVRWARALGYRRIGLTTNGRRLGYEAYARGLFESGLNHLVVSVHGPDAHSHDAQTRCPGSFDQTIAGLGTVARLRREYRFSAHSSTVITRRNVERLPEIHALLRSFSLDQNVFNVMQAVGSAAPLAKQLMARYTDVAAAFARLVATVPPPRRIFLVDIPYCTTERLPGEVRGSVEPAFFNVVDRDGNSKARRLTEHKAARYGEKRAECARCRYDDACLGVWREYIRAHGWDEFVPVQRTPDGAPPVFLPLRR